MSRSYERPRRGWGVKTLSEAFEIEDRVYVDIRNELRPLIEEKGLTFLSMSENTTREQLWELTDPLVDRLPRAVRDRITGHEARQILRDIGVSAKECLKLHLAHSRKRKTQGSGDNRQKATRSTARGLENEPPPAPAPLTRSHAPNSPHTAAPIDSTRAGTDEQNDLSDNQVRPLPVQASFSHPQFMDISMRNIYAFQDGSSSPAVCGLVDLFKPGIEHLTDVRQFSYPRWLNFLAEDCGYDATCHQIMYVPSSKGNPPRLVPNERIWMSVVSEVITRPGSGHIVFRIKPIQRNVDRNNLNNGAYLPCTNGSTNVRNGSGELSLVEVDNEDGGTTPHASRTQGHQGNTTTQDATADGALAQPTGTERPYNLRMFDGYSSSSDIDDSSGSSYGKLYIQ